MKRLLGLAVLFVVLSVCVPSYGYFLIYNVTTTVNGDDGATDAKTAVPLKGFLVLNLNSSGDFVDANLIIYGNDSNTPRKQKVYAVLNHSDIANLLSVDIWYIGNDMFVDFWTDSPFNFEIFMSGKAKSQDIGLGRSNMEWVAGSIKGVNIVWDGILLGPSASQNVSGTGSASASLWTAATKYVNANSWTQDQIILNGDPNNHGLIPILAGKGYHAAVLP